ncbi:uncharacterized protein J5M81_008470 isoform 1-T1 [Pluvialis apricaria]
MINAILVFNNHGKPRLVRFYQHLAEEVQQQIIRETFHLVLKRDDHICNFLECGSLFGGSDYKLIYRHYATLYFVFCVDSSESELGILDLIQVFVETLDKCFENVCELDLIFHMDKVHHILQEVVIGGMVLETNMNEIVAQVEAQSKLEKAEGGPLGRSFPCRLGCEEHQPARDPSQHQHRRHQHQSAQPVTVHVSVPRWGGLPTRAGCGLGWLGRGAGLRWAPPAPSGALPVRHTVDPACCRGAWAVWWRVGSGDGAQRGWGGAACLSVTSDLGSVLLTGLPTRRVAIPSLPPCGCAASLLTGEEPVPAPPGTSRDSWL